MKDYIVHIGVKIYGTYVWEGAAGPFDKKEQAQEWEEAFMAATTSRSANFSTLVMEVNKDAVKTPAELAEALDQEAVEFLQGLQSKPRSR